MSSPGSSMRVAKEKEREIERGEEERMRRRE